MWYNGTACQSLFSIIFSGVLKWQKEGTTKTENYGQESTKDQMGGMHIGIRIAMVWNDGYTAGNS